MAATVADILVERLIDWNVNTIFALPGDGINGLYEALRTHQEAIRLVQVLKNRRESVARAGDHFKQILHLRDVEKGKKLSEPFSCPRGSWKGYSRKWRRRNHGRGGHRVLNVLA